MKDFFRSPLWVLRIGLFAVFFWFGSNEVFYPSLWVGWIPKIFLDIFSLEYTSSALIYSIQVHGLVELLAAFLLLFGKYVKFGAIIMVGILSSIIVFSGINEITVRDFGLFTAALTLFLVYRKKII